MSYPLRNMTSGSTLNVNQSRPNLDSRQQASISHTTLISSPTRPSFHAKKPSDDLEKPEGTIPYASKPDPGAGFPDGGLQAWLCVFGGFFNLFVSFGWINCIGIFQNYYQSNLLSSYSPSTIAWIPSVELFIMFLVGPICGRIFDVSGPRFLLLAGSFLHVFGLMMTSLSTELYQLILAQSICSSLGTSAIFFSAMSSTSTWFFHKRALAIGIVTSGSSLGGVIFPIFVQKLIPQIGFGWTMRACAFIILGMMVISNLTVRTRLPPNPSNMSPKMLYKPFAEPAFALVTVGSFFIFFGLFVPFDFLILEAKAVGVRPQLAEYLVPILNAVSILGRTLPGYLGDKFGRFNVITGFCYAAGILCVALWLPGTSEGAVIAFAALYGFTSGAFVSMIPACIAQISPIQQIGIRNGSLFATISVAGLVGNPIAGALVSEDGGHFGHLQIFTAVTLIAGTSFLLFARINLGGLKLVKV